MKISIIVPIYNVEKYLKRCVESLLNQDYRDIEIILVDDGSPDNSGKICEEYAKSDSRIKVIHKKNGGLSDARNTGVQEAEGDYILFVDADDTLNKSACKELVEIICKYNADIVCFNLNLIDEEVNKKIKGKYFNYDDNFQCIKMTYIDTIKNNILRKFIRYEAPSKIYKKEIVEKIKFPIGVFAEDFAVFYKFLKEAQNIIYYNRNLYNYYQRSSSIMGKKSEKLYIDVYNAEKEYYKEVKELNIGSELLKKAENNFFKTLVKTLAKINKNSNADLIINLEKDFGQINYKYLTLDMKCIYLIFKYNRTLFSKIMRLFKKV